MAFIAFLILLLILLRPLATTFGFVGGFAVAAFQHIKHRDRSQKLPLVAVLQLIVIFLILVMIAVCVFAAISLS